MSRRQKILVTGGSGQVGEFIIKELKEKSDVIVFDIMEPKDRGVGFIKGDISDLGSLKEATKDIDSIVHLAAYSKERLIPGYSEG